MPDCAYIAGSNSFAGTGLQFSSDFSVIKGAIAVRRAAGGRTLLSVGGDIYFNWAGLNAAAIRESTTDGARQQHDCTLHALTNAHDAPIQQARALTWLVDTGMLIAQCMLIAGQHRDEVHVLHDVLA